MKPPRYRHFSSKSDKGRNAELCLVARMNAQPGTKAFRQPGSKGAGDVIVLARFGPTRVAQVKSGRRPAKPEVERLKACIREQWPFYVEAQVVWAKRCDHMGHPTLPLCDGWGFEWL